MELLLKILAVCIVVPGIIVLLYYVFSVAVLELAKEKILVTIVSEPTAEVVMQNGQVSKILMTQRGKKFQGTQQIARTDFFAVAPIGGTAPPPAENAGAEADKDEADQWEIVPDTASHNKNPSRLNLLQGVSWVGIPPFSYIHRYKFAWTSLEEKTGPDGNLVRVSHWQEKEISHILLRFDLYATKIEGAECLDKIPLDGIILVGGIITNPYKALFRVERWLEAVHNLVGAKMRDFFGGKRYEDLLKISTTPASADQATPVEIMGYFGEVVTKVKKDWGFDISVIRLYSISPGSKEAEAFIRASTQLYVAEQQALARTKEGEGLIARDVEYFRQIAAVPGGQEMFKWMNFPKQLTAYAEGSSRTVSTLPLEGRPFPPTIDQER